MIYSSIGYKPRDDWILSKDVMIATARFRAVRTVPLPLNTIIKEAIIWQITRLFR